LLYTKLATRQFLAYTMYYHIVLYHLTRKPSHKSSNSLYGFNWFVVNETNRLID